MQLSPLMRSPRSRLISWQGRLCAVVALACIALFLALSGHRSARAASCGMNLASSVQWHRRHSQVEVTFRNAGSCAQLVGLASYSRFTGDHPVPYDQQLFDAATYLLAAGETRTLRIRMPSCAFQFDAFYGPVLTGSQLAEGELYGDRIVSSYLDENRAYCVANRVVSTTPTTRLRVHAPSQAITVRTPGAAGYQAIVATATVTPGPGIPPRSRMPVKAPAGTIDTLLDPRVRLFKASDRGVAAPGQRVVFTIRIGNPGLIDDTNITVTDRVPPAFQVLRASSPNADVTVRGQVVITKVALLPAGATVRTQVITRVAERRGGYFSNVASLRWYRNGLSTASIVLTAMSTVEVIGLPPTGSPLRTVTAAAPTAWEWPLYWLVLGLAAPGGAWLYRRRRSRRG